jgi:hypothetical protein
VKFSFFKILTFVLCSVFSFKGVGQVSSSHLEVRTYSEVELETGFYLLPDIILSDEYFDFSSVNLFISTGVKVDQITLYNSELISIDAATNSILFENKIIGVFSGELSTESDDFKIQFNASANKLSIQATLRSLFIFNQNPQPGTRNLLIKLQNAENDVTKIVNNYFYQSPQELVVFDDENMKEETTVALVDIDDDTDFDLIVGDKNGVLTFYRNTGDSNNPLFVLDTENSPLTSVSTLNLTYSFPAFTDIDGDGDFDFFLGENKGIVTFYENIGSKSAPEFVLNDEANPFKERINYTVKPNFLDINSDGLIDALFGRLNGGLSYYENIGTKFEPSFVLKGYGDNIFQDVREHSRAAPFLYDFNYDGFVDLLLGETDGSLNLYLNLPVNDMRSYIKQSDEENQFNTINVGEHVTPIFVDINNDGFPDLISGNKAGEVKVLYDDSKFSFEISPVNDAPIIDVISTQDVDENTRFVTSLSITDEEGDDWQVELFGDDALQFEVLENNDLNFIANPNFELPADQNADNIYSLSIQVTDVAGASNILDLTITVLDINEAPTIKGDEQITVTENRSELALFEIENPETESLIIELLGDDGALFNLNDKGVLSFISPADFELPLDKDKDNNYQLTIVVTDEVEQSAQIDLEITVDNEIENISAKYTSVDPFEEDDISDGLSAKLFSNIMLNDFGEDFADQKLTISGLLDGDNIQLVASDSSEFIVYENEVIYQGNLIATIDNENNGVNGSSFSMTFTEFATADIIHSIFQSLMFSSDLANPQSQRVITFNFTHPRVGNISIVNYNGFELMPNLNPFNGMSFGKSVKPSFADVDNDGDLDSFVTQFAKQLQSYNNVTNDIDIAFVEDNQAVDAFSEVMTRYERALTFSKLNYDNKVDVLAGENDGTLDFFLNVGTTEQPQFAELMNANNPFYLLDVGDNSTPVFVDIDGDSDSDVFVGSLSGNVYYFENSGDGYTFKFDVNIDDVSSHILEDIKSSKSSVPSFVDFDQDGDFDLVLGNASGTLQYYQNIGNYLSPMFVELIGEDNPFNKVSVSSYSAPTFIDLDMDGDSDLLIGSDDGSISYFKNNSGILLEVLGANDTPQINAQPLYTVIENHFVIGQVSFLDADGDTVNLKVEGVDAHWINIDDNGVMSFSQLMIHDNPMDFDGDNIYQFDVIVEDPQGAQSSVTTSVQIIESAPVDFSQTNTFLVSENSTYVAIVKLRDENDNAYRFTLTGEDKDVFEINALGQLVFNANPNYENPMDKNLDNQYELDVITTDTDGNSTINPINIKVVEVNEAPELTLFSNVSVSENSVEVIQAQVQDPENENVTYSLSGQDSALFTIDTQGYIKFVVAPNFEKPSDKDVNNQYDIAVIATDERGANSTSNTAIVVNNVVEMNYLGPTSISIVENTTFVQVIDVDYLDKTELSYQLLGDDHVHFNIDDYGQLSFKHDINFESPIDDDLNNNYQVMVKVSDIKGESIEVELSVSVIDVNEAPAILSANRVEVDENTQLSYLLEIFDPENDELTVILSGDDKPHFQLIDGYLELNQIPNFESPNDYNLDGEYSLTVSINDGEYQTNIDLIVVVVNQQEQAEVTGLTNISLGKQSVTNGNMSAILPNVSLIDPDNNYQDHQIIISGLLSEDSITLIDNEELELSFNEDTGDVYFKGMVIAQIDPNNSGIAGSNFLISFNELANNDAVEAVLTSLSYGNNSEQPTESRTLSIIIKDETGNQLNLYNAVDFLTLENNAAPLFNIDVGENAYPSFADIDNDNDLDLLIGTASGELKLFINDGNSLTPDFIQLASSNTLLTEFASSFHSSPSFVDIDNDGDQDLFIGDSDGFIRLIRNTSTGSSLSYQQSAASENPFSGIDAGSLAKISFVDIDGDRDLDAFISNSLGNIRFFLNSGTASNPSFSEKLMNENPLYTIKGYFSVVTTFIDIDKDDDYDLVLGNTAGSLVLYENTGSANAALFEISTAENNPFLDFAVKGASVPVFVDIDGDSDLDLFVGDINGQIAFSKNVAGITLTIDNSDYVNLAPVITLDSIKTVNAGDFVILEANVEDDDAANLSYKWYQNSGDPIDMLNNDSYKFTFTAPMVEAEKQLEFELIVHDGELSSSSIILVTVKAQVDGEVIVNRAPIIEMISDMSVTSGSEVTLQAIISDADGDDLIYSWTQTTGITVEMFNTNTLTPTIKIPEVDEQTGITVMFEVSDGEAISEKSITILIEKQDVIEKNDAGGVIHWYIFSVMILLILSRRKYQRKSSC